MPGTSIRLAIAICLTHAVLVPARAAAQASSTTTTAASAPAPVRPPRDLRDSCAKVDSARTLRRAVGDSLGARIPGADSARVTNGTPRSRSYPEYDVVLDVPNLCVDRLALKVDSLSARLNLTAAISNLVRVNAGVDVAVGKLDLTIQGVRATALLLVDLDDVVHIVDQTLTFVDNHPEIVTQLGNTLQSTGAAVGTVTGTVVGTIRALLLSTTRLTDGSVVQHVVDQASGSLIDRTLSAAGQLLGQKTIGNVLTLAPLRDVTSTATQLVRQVRDPAGNVIEYTLDRTRNTITSVRLVP